MGDYERARAHIEKVFLIEPEAVDALATLATYEYRSGNFEGAEQQFEVALRVSKTHEDSMKVYDKLAKYHALRGEDYKVG